MVLEHVKILECPNYTLQSLGQALVNRSKVNIELDLLHGNSRTDATPLEKHVTVEMSSKEALPPIYNSTFTLHRLSPLNVPDTASFFSTSSLSSHARCLTESLKGGLLQDTTLFEQDLDGSSSNFGILKQCQWTPLGFKEGQWEDNQASATADGIGVLTGLRIDLEYERTKYVAILLNDHSAQEFIDASEFALPLMFSRMPAPIRLALFDYLAVAFDVRIEVLRLNDDFMIYALDSLISDLSEDADDEDVDYRERILKDVQFSLGFRMPIQASLKTLDISIQREDVEGFLSKGTTTIQSKNNSTEPKEGPFKTALREWLKKNMALNLDHDSVYLSRIACGAFALGREGKIKLFAPRLSHEEHDDETDLTTPHEWAMIKLLRSLLSAAKGNRETAAGRLL